MSASNFDKEWLLMAAIKSSTGFPLTVAQHKVATIKSTTDFKVGAMSARVTGQCPFLQLLAARTERKPGWSHGRFHTDSCFTIGRRFTCLFSALGTKNAANRNVQKNWDFSRCSLVIGLACALLAM